MQLRKNFRYRKKADIHEEAAPSLTCAFLPESSDKFPTCVGLKAGLLTRFTFCGLPVARTVAMRIQKAIKKLTASGNVRDSHPVPFSFRCLSGNL